MNTKPYLPAPPGVEERQRIVELERQVALLDARNQELRRKHEDFRIHIRKVESDNLRLKENNKDLARRVGQIRNILRSLYDWCMTVRSPGEYWDCPVMQSARHELRVQ